MNPTLQIILMIASVSFFIFIFTMVRDRKLDIKYALTWILTSFSFVLLSIFPGIVGWIAGLLFILEPVNALFLIVIFFLLLIVFTLTIALSRQAEKLKSLTQEMGMMQLKMEQQNRKRDEL